MWANHLKKKRTGSGHESIETGPSILKFDAEWNWMKNRRESQRRSGFPPTGFRNVNERGTLTRRRARFPSAARGAKQIIRRSQYKMKTHKQTNGNKPSPPQKKKNPQNHRLAIRHLPTMSSFLMRSGRRFDLVANFFAQWRSAAMTHLISWRSGEMPTLAPCVFSLIPSTGSNSNRRRVQPRGYDEKSTVFDVFFHDIAFLFSFWRVGFLLLAGRQELQLMNALPIPWLPN